MNSARFQYSSILRDRMCPTQKRTRPKFRNNCEVQVHRNIPVNKETQFKTNGYILHTYFMKVSYLAYLRPWIWRRYIHSKGSLTFARLDGIISQKIQSFIPNVVSIFKFRIYQSTAIFFVYLFFPKILHREQQQEIHFPLRSKKHTRYINSFVL